MESTKTSTKRSRNTIGFFRKHDFLRLKRLCELETRGLVDQIQVILDEACERRGLDPETMEPVTPSNRK